HEQRHNHPGEVRHVRVGEGREDILESGSTPGDEDAQKATCHQREGDGHAQQEKYQQRADDDGAQFDRRHWLTPLISASSPAGTGSPRKIRRRTSHTSCSQRMARPKVTMMRDGQTGKVIAPKVISPRMVEIQASFPVYQTSRPTAAADSSVTRVSCTRRTRGGRCATMISTEKFDLPACTDARPR